MKKIFAILALAISGSAFAGSSVTLESQHINNVSSADQTQYLLLVKQDFTNMFAGDISFSNAETQGTNAIGTRLDAGVTATAPVFSNIKGYARVGMGQKYSNTTNFTYYTIEPGLTMPVGPFNAKVGVRYRSATDATLFNDQTHTARVSLSYALNKTDSVAVGYDRVRGDSDQKVAKLSYTRGF